MLCYQPVSSHAHSACGALPSPSPKPATLSPKAGVDQIATCAPRARLRKENNRIPASGAPRRFPFLRLRARCPAHSLTDPGSEASCHLRRLFTSTTPPRTHAPTHRPLPFSLSMNRRRRGQGRSPRSRKVRRSIPGGLPPGCPPCQYPPHPGAGRDIIDRDLVELCRRGRTARDQAR